MKNKLCECRSHCTKYDPATDTYVGPGHQIPFKTAQRHALDDKRAEALGNLSGRAVPSTSDHSLSPSDTEDIESLSHQELFALEAEIAGRVAWTHMDCPLIFFKSPGHSQDFVLPKPSEIHLSNCGPHALDPTHHANTAYIENEMRLCEILVYLHEQRFSGVPLGYLEEKVQEGLAQMWKHKEAEWRRHRYRSVAIHHGFSVVDMSASLQMFPSSQWHQSNGF